MIWASLLRIARAQLRRWLPAGEVIDGLILDVSKDVSEEVTASVYPPPLPDPLSTPYSYLDVQRNEALKRSAAHAFPPTLDTLPSRAPPPRARSSAVPAPIMPAPIRPPRKR